MKYKYLNKRQQWEVSLECGFAQTLTGFHPDALTPDVYKHLLNNYASRVEEIDDEAKEYLLKRRPQVIGLADVFAERVFGG